MITGLLENTLDRLASLENFYISECDSIEKKSRKGMSPNSYGYLVKSHLVNLSRGVDITKSNETRKVKEVVESFIDIIEENKSDGSVRYSYEFKDREWLVNAGFELDIHKATKEFVKYAEMPIIHANNTLIMLITRFEDFIARLVSCLFKMYPKQYLDNQQVSFSEITNNGIDEIREMIVHHEVDALMRKSYTEWFKLFENHGFSFSSCKTELEDLKELYARRNIVVHNMGKVNEIYLKNVPISKAKKGDTLNADKEYLGKAFFTIRVVVFSIMLEATKIVTSDKDDYLYAIFSIAFELLKQKEYKLCKHVFACIKQNKYGSESTRKLSQVNYWLSEKGLNGSAAIRDEVSKFDVSALALRYKMAKALLLDEYDKATETISELFRIGEISASVLTEWPLFADYRDTVQFAEFQKTHPQEFNIEVVDVDPQSNDSVTKDEIIINALDSVTVV